MKLFAVRSSHTTVRLHNFKNKLPLTSFLNEHLLQVESARVQKLKRRSSTIPCHSFWLLRRQGTNSLHKEKTQQEKNIYSSHPQFYSSLRKDALHLLCLGGYFHAYLLFSKDAQIFLCSKDSEIFVNADLKIN